MGLPDHAKNQIHFIALNAPEFETDPGRDLASSFAELQDLIARLGLSATPAVLGLLAKSWAAFESGDKGSGARLLISVLDYLPDAKGKSPSASIGSFGGPRIIVPEATHLQWKGVPESGWGGHYQLACEAGDPGVIRPWDADIPVIGCAPLDLFVLPSSAGARLYAWEFGDTPAAVEGLAMSTLLAAEWDESVQVTLAGGKYLVFDAAVGGAEIEEFLRLTLEGGEYAFSTAYREEGECGVTVYDLRLVGGDG